MAKRGPAAPVIPLYEALQRARKIYEAEHSNPMTPEVIAQHIGYKGISGTSLSMIATLRQYGILEGRGDDVRLSEDVITVFADEEIGSEERGDALAMMLGKPPLFQEIMDTFPNAPSAPNIRAFVAKRGFSTNAASSIANIYLESMEFVDLEISSYSRAIERNTEKPNMEQVVTSESNVSLLPSVTVPAGKLTEIEYVRVSKRLGIRLMADGPFTKKDMKIFSKRIASAITDGVYDDLEDESNSDPGTDTQGE